MNLKETEINRIVIKFVKEGEKQTKTYTLFYRSFLYEKNKQTKINHWPQSDTTGPTRVR